jgi:hypothetical protein
MQDRIRCGRFRLSGTRTRRRNVETLGPDFQGGMSRPASSDDAVVFPEALSEAAELVAEKAELSTAAADLSRSASSDDAVVFPESLSEAAAKLVAEEAELSAEVADLRAWVDAVDTVNAAPTRLDDVTFDEPRSALSEAFERFSAEGDART